MSHSQGPPGRRPLRRLSPDELALEVARRLKTGSSPRGGHRRRRGFDIVTMTRILMALVVVGLAAGAAYGVAWIGRVAGYGTTGKVIETRAVFGCPGESELGAVFDGETVEVVGRSEDGRFYVLRDQRGPGGLVYVEAEAVGEVEDPDRLPVRSCQPRSESEVAVAEVSSPTTTPMIVSTTSRAITTTVPDMSTTTGAEPGSGRPSRRGTPGPGAPPTTSPPAPTGPTTPTTPGTSPTNPPTTGPGVPGTSPTTAPTTTTTTTTTMTTTTTTTITTTTTTSPTTTTTETPATTTTISESTTTTTATDP